MEDAEIINLWKSYHKKLDESLSINKKNTEDITKLKVRSFLMSMKPIKIFTILAGIAWVGFVDVIIIALFQEASPFFLVSAGIQVILTKIAIGIYVYQLVLMHQMDISESVISAQNKLANLKLSTLWVTRVLFLQLPVWTTFYCTVNMFKYGNPVGLAIQVLITLLFTFAAVWLFFNIRYENVGKKWFQLIFNGIEWNPIVKSMELLGQIEEYKTGNHTLNENLSY